MSIPTGLVVQVGNGQWLSTGWAQLTSVDFTAETTQHLNNEEHKEQLYIS